MIAPRARQAFPGPINAATNHRKVIFGSIILRVSDVRLFHPGDQAAQRHGCGRHANVYIGLASRPGEQTISLLQSRKAMANARSIGVWPIGQLTQALKCHAQRR
jgi:hypothetical protein